MKRNHQDTRKQVESILNNPENSTVTKVTRKAVQFGWKNSTLKAKAIAYQKAMEDTNIPIEIQKDQL